MFKNGSHDFKYSNGTIIFNWKCCKLDFEYIESYDLLLITKRQLHLDNLMYLYVLFFVIFNEAPWRVFMFVLCTWNYDDDDNDDDDDGDDEDDGDNNSNNNNRIMIIITAL